MKRIGKYNLKKGIIINYLNENKISKTKELTVKDFFNIRELNGVGTGTVKKILEAFMLENDCWIKDFEILKIMYPFLKIDYFWNNKKITDVNKDLISDYRKISTTKRRRNFFKKVNEYLIWVSQIHDVKLKKSNFTYDLLISNIKEIESQINISKEEKLEQLNETIFDLEIPKSFKIKLKEKDFKNVLKLFMNIPYGNYNDFIGKKYKQIKEKYDMSFENIEGLKKEIEFFYTGRFITSEIIKSNKKFKIFKMRFSEKAKLREIGKEFNFTRERARQIIKELEDVFSMDYYINNIKKMIQYHIYPDNFITKEELDKIFFNRDYISNYIYDSFFPKIWDNKIGIYHFKNVKFQEKLKISLETEKMIFDLKQNLADNPSEYNKIKKPLIEWMKKEKYYVYGKFFFKNTPSLIDLIILMYSEGLENRALGLDDESETFVKNALKKHFDVSEDFNWRGLHNRLYLEETHPFIRIDLGTIQYIKNTNITNDLIDKIRAELVKVKTDINNNVVQIRYLYENLDFKKFKVKNHTILYSIIKNYCDDIVSTSVNRSEEIIFSNNVEPKKLIGRFEKLLSKDKLTTKKAVFEKLLWTNFRLDNFMNYNRDKYIYWTGDTICHVDYLKITRTELNKIKEILNKKYFEVFSYMIDIKEANIIENFTLDTPKKLKKFMKFYNLEFGWDKVEHVSISEDFELVSSFIVEELKPTEPISYDRLIEIVDEQDIKRKTFYKWTNILKQLKIITEPNQSA